MQAVLPALANAPCAAAAGALRFARLLAPFGSAARPASTSADAALSSGARHAAPDSSSGAGCGTPGAACVSSDSSERTTTNSSASTSSRGGSGMPGWGGRRPQRRQDGSGSGGGGGLFRLGAAAAPAALRRHTTVADTGPAAGQERERPRRGSVDPREVEKFAALADQWWDQASGPFAPLHALNAARCLFIRRALCASLGRDAAPGEPLAGLRVLDVGCGGGLLSEPLARMGAAVRGIDLSEASVGAAAAHAAGDPAVASRVEYLQRSAEEELAASPAGGGGGGEGEANGGGGAGSGGDGGAPYDVVVASEVIEHVRAPAEFLKTLAALAGARGGGGGGRVVVSTLNRTPAAFALAIAGAEYAAALVPRGTHEWSKFITPGELAMMAAGAGLELEQIVGMGLEPLRSGARFVLTEDLGVNYIAMLRQRRG
ncbi:MAG: S-adenosyl-L-methionine-dependent methyltransferase [Monoraphidium minutum]|nr:MAG: S-adenosyl-L-methionine-dependent methyltransferase [Monoraphidium minutum]